MAQDTAIGTEKPIGTIHQLRKLGRKLNDYGSCSLPGDGGGIPGNKGCPHYGKCEFTRYRDGDGVLRDPVADEERIEGIGHGPGMIGVYRKVGSNDAIQGLIMPCHEWYTGGNAEIRNRAMQQNTGDAFSPFLYEGDEIDIRLRGHDLKDGEKCEDCRRGKCTIMEDIVRTVEIPRHKTPADLLKSVVWGNEIEKKMRDRMREASEAKATDKFTVPPDDDSTFVLGDHPMRGKKGGGSDIPAGGVDALKRKSQEAKAS